MSISLFIIELFLYNFSFKIIIKQLMVLISNNNLKNHYIIFDLIQLKQYLLMPVNNLYNQDELIYFLHQFRI